SPPPHLTPSPHHPIPPSPHPPITPFSNATFKMKQSTTFCRAECRVQSFWLNMSQNANIFPLTIRKFGRSR
ncbi:hypothetical protein, partial [Okeania sp. SIO3B5]|uniref:hypothetical protein n=1 Tax=Okeania sp. SIO3B5 TaxID=2607811 RepID=UPI0025D3935B